MVEDENRPLRSAAAVMNVTVQSVSAQYRKYVAPLHGNRQKLYKNHSHSDRNYRELMLAIPYLGEFAQRAIDAGHTVEPTFWCKGKVATRQLRVNGKCCLLQIARIPRIARRGSEIAYAGYQISVRRRP